MSKENKSVQDKIAELTNLMEWFDSEDFSLEQALEKFRQAEGLAETIEQDLKSFKNDIQIIKKKFDSET